MSVSDIDRVITTIKQHRLISSSDLACLSFGEKGRSGDVLRVVVQQLDKEECASAEPKRFALEINTPSGSATWDAYAEGEMVPIPPRTGPDKGQTRPLRYADWFIKSGCNWDKVYTNGETYRSPYPEDLLDYVPSARQLTEFLWNNGNCPRKRPHERSDVAISLPRGFSCRLDRLMLKELTTRKTFPVRRAAFEAGFQYGRGAGATRDHLGEPLELRERFYKSYDSVEVEIMVGRKPYVLSSANIIGSPAHIESVYPSGQFGTGEFAKPGDLPVVTDRSAERFVFNPRIELPSLKELMPAGLRDMTWVPFGCQRRAALRPITSVRTN